MKAINKVLTGLLGSLLLTTIAKPSNAITFSLGGTSVPGEGQFSSMPGVTTIDFNSGAAPTSGPIVYSASGGSPTIVEGTVWGSAAPLDDSSKYLVVSPFRVGDPGNFGTSPVTINSNNGLLDYFGLYWGSMDYGNRIDFYQGNTLLQSFTGGDIITSFPVNRGGEYVNFSATGASDYFDKIVLSPSLPFESDNHAIKCVEVEDCPPSSIPEPTSAIGLLVFGAFAYGLRKGEKVANK
ncbi:MAG: hypothetical protein F6K40_07600 [Okeania sp. SIO3I5]|uniref:Npun_F0296 family exosortase-dependent surface protein n=1 Tax=Okeania sp. SIO3I5 TaxID=2607805 RepID=UPI0013B6F0CC|nr:hypothetical protein [Okeania sp. SIO3I5]NEQ36157.1 hypothetical protein [Okeania sp. SIO3I5]